MKTLVVLALVLSLACSPAVASNCGVQAVRRNVVVKKNVVAVQKVVAVPVQQFATVLQVVAPAAYYSVGAAVQEQALEERISRRHRAELKKEIGELKQLLRQALSADAGKVVPLPPAEAPLGLTILQTSCAKCHKPDSKAVIAKQAPILFDTFGNLAASQVQIGAMLVATRNGIMPPAPAEPLDDDSYLAIKSYLNGVVGGTLQPVRPTEDLMPEASY